MSSFEFDGVWRAEKAAGDGYLVIRRLEVAGKRSREVFGAGIGCPLHYEKSVAEGRAGMLNRECGSCPTCAQAQETRAFPCDECGALDEAAA